MGSGDIDIIQGTKDAFKEKMQKVYTFLTDCIESIDGCKILQKLNFQTNLSEQQSKINTTKDSINGLLGIVYNCEEDMISLDESSSNRLDVLLSAGNKTISPNNLNADENNEELGTYNNNNSRRTSGSGNSGGSPDYGGYYGPNDNVNNNEKTDLLNEDNLTNSNIDVSNCYQINIDKEEAMKAGDIFIESDYSLTKLTNNILAEIKVENNDSGREQAKALYNIIINYGKEYYANHFENPATKQTLTEIITNLYTNFNKYTTQNGDVQIYQSVYELLGKAINK